MSRILGTILFLVYLGVGLVIAANHHYFNHLTSAKPIISVCSPCCSGHWSSSGWTSTSSRWIQGHSPRLPMRYDRVNLNVHSVLVQLRSSEPLAPT